jgi:hypothetical protein
MNHYRNLGWKIIGDTPTLCVNHANQYMGYDPSDDDDSEADVLSYTPDGSPIMVWDN